MSTQRIAQALGGEVIVKLHELLVKMAQERSVIQGGKMRVDTTVVETNIHYPTDSKLLGDGARVLTRTMKKIEAKGGKLKRAVRNRMQCEQRVVAIATASRHQGESGELKRKKQYRELLCLTRQILNDTRRVMEETESRRKPAIGRWRQQLSTMAERVQQVVKQTKARVFQGITKLPGKIVSVFEPHTEIIRKGKASKPTEFGKLVQITEAEHQIVTRLDVFDERASDRHLLTEAVKEQVKLRGRTPALVTADASYYAQAHERDLQKWASNVWRCRIAIRRARSAGRGKRPLVQEGAGMAHRVRGADQRTKAEARVTAFACIAGSKG